ncbi:YceK/YidQ family lipoprotein [Pseudomonas sp. xss_1]|uniref:YceK/YidQ family lipoprotein n=1 Tax=Pseudomonas sp. xss_1 TaxID=3367214 RepID=UPI00370BA2DE
MKRGLAGTLAVLMLGGCATVRTLDGTKPGAPVVYAGTRLDWYAIGGGCCPQARFGVEAPRFASLDLPASFLLDTLLLPLTLPAAAGIYYHGSGGF